MMRIIYALGLLSSATLAASTVFSTAGSAELLVEQVWDARLVLAFRVDPAELKKVIPGPWEITGTAAGPAKDANFNVIFYERMVQQDGAGASMEPPYRFVVFASAVKPHEASAGCQCCEPDLPQRSEAGSRTLQEQFAFDCEAPERD